MSKFWIVVIIFFLAQGVCAQKLIKAGDIALEREQYSQAINFYDAQLKKTKNNKTIIAKASFKAGYCYKKLSEPAIARNYFINAIANGYEDPIVHLYYGEALHMLQKYDSSLVEYEIFKQLDPKHKLSDKGIESINFTFSSLKAPSRYIVDIYGVLNSGEYDYCPFYEVKNKKKIYFTSTRYAPTHKSINPESGEYCSNLFFSEQDKNGKWSIPVIVPGLVNTSDEEGAACLNRKSSNLYFTRCKYDKEFDKGCRIYTAKRVGSYWGQIQEILIPGIPQQISIGHPAISDDELTLYFIADSLLGGMGEKIFTRLLEIVKTHHLDLRRILGHLSTPKQTRFTPIFVVTEIYIFRQTDTQAWEVLIFLELNMFLVLNIIFSILEVLLIRHMMILA